MGKGKKADHPVTITRDLYVDELEKASKRIGATIDGVAIWFARFAQRNLQNLSTGEWTDLLYEVAALSEFQYQLSGERALWSCAITTHDWAGKERTKDRDELQRWIKQFLTDHANDGSLPYPRPPYELPPRDEVARLQEETITALTELQEHLTYTVDLPSVTLLYGVRPSTDEIARLGILANPRQLFQYNLAWTLGMGAVRIRRCDGCQAWFFADRKNKTYCSSSCQSRAGTRRYRAEIERKHQESVKGLRSAKAHTRTTNKGEKRHGTNKGPRHRAGGNPQTMRRSPA
jgi:hypothetical protein